MIDIIDDMSHQFISLIYNQKHIRIIIENNDIDKGEILELSNLIKDLLKKYKKLQDFMIKRIKSEEVLLISENCKEMEKELITRAINTNSNKTLIAKELGMSRRTLYRKLKKYNIK